MYLEDNKGEKWDILMHWDWDFFLVGMERHNNIDLNGIYFCIS